MTYFNDEWNKKETPTYKEWFKSVKFLKDKIILPGGTTIDKDSWIKKDGFDIDGFNKLLFKVYNEQYPVSDGRRYKK
jgi:hypothetical protein